MKKDHVAAMVALSRSLVTAELLRVAMGAAAAHLGAEEEAMVEEELITVLGMRVGEMVVMQVGLQDQR